MAEFFTDPATLIGLGAVAAATAYYVATRPTPVKPPYPLENQSVELLVLKLDKQCPIGVSVKL